MQHNFLFKLKKYFESFFFLKCFWAKISFSEQDYLTEDFDLKNRNKTIDGQPF